MTEKVKLHRLDPNIPWGFRLTGGLDFGTPLTVVKVTGRSIASEAGIKVGDIVTEINGKSTKQLTHIEAQNWIVRSGNLIYFSVIRGSVVSPASTPFRGSTPVTVCSDVQNGYDAMSNGNYEVYDQASVVSGGSYTYHQNDGSVCMEDGLTEREYTLLNGGEVPRPCTGVLSDNVSDLEIDELLTGHEEVLDQGLLGINFQKFFPQVDFIKHHSDVFKVLQDENTHKELPEQVQLKIDPSKRFSTFLQKPSGPPARKKVCGSYWHYRKAPNYLPRKPRPPPEQPKRRKEDTHSVIWLFLRKDGDKVIGERWGTPDEEKKNVSRNTNREDEGVIMPPLSNRNTPLPSADFSSDKEPVKREYLKPEDFRTTVTSPVDSTSKFDDQKTMEQKIEEIVGPSDDEAHHIQDAIKEVIHAVEEIRNVTPTGNRSRESHRDDHESTTETIAEETEEKTAEENLEIQKTFQLQLGKIQQQIVELEGKAPKDLISQLSEVQEQLNRILLLNNNDIKAEFNSIEDESCEMDHLLQSTCETSTSEAEGDSEYVINYTINPYKKTEEATQEIYDEFTIEINNIDKTPTLEVIEDDRASITTLEKYEMGEFEVCDATEELIKEAQKYAPEKLKKPFHPLTPAARPIVLPGGRQWRQPKDAAHDDFYQGILVEQAEILIGSNKSVNFKKYVPPKFDTDASPVCKLIRELEMKTDSTERKPEAEYYYQPLTKRHFYNATLPQPPPVGAVELRDLI